VATAPLPTKSALTTEFVLPAIADAQKKARHAIATVFCMAANAGVKRRRSRPLE
jgi:hypothetical protein